MTMTTPEATTQHIHVRGNGYAELQKIHRDHSATVRLGDGTEQRVPFGDWVYAACHPQYENKGISGVTKFIADALTRDLGEDFTVTGEVAGTSAVTGETAASFLASYGPDYLVEVKVTPCGGF